MSKPCYLLSICILLRDLNIYILFTDSRQYKITGSFNCTGTREERANRKIKKKVNKYLPRLTFLLQIMNFNKVCQSDWLFSRKSFITIINIWTKKIVVAKEYYSEYQSERDLKKKRERRVALNSLFRIIQYIFYLYQVSPLQNVLYFEIRTFIFNSELPWLWNRDNRQPCRSLVEFTVDIWVLIIYFTANINNTKNFTV